MARRFGVRNVGVRDGRRLRKVVGSRFLDDRHGGHYWEVLSCGHLGNPIGFDGAATQRWCADCRSAPPKPPVRADQQHTDLGQSVS